jgi:hypothetical protein
MASPPPQPPNASNSNGNSNAPPRAPSRENRILRRVMSIPSVDELGQVLAKADGKDRVVGLLQYVALFASGGRGGAFTTRRVHFRSLSRLPHRIQSQTLPRPERVCVCSPWVAVDPAP